MITTNFDRWLSVQIDGLAQCVECKGWAPLVDCNTHPEIKDLHMCKACVDSAEF